MFHLMLCHQGIIICMEYRVVFRVEFNSYELYSDWMGAEEARDTFENVRRNPKELYIAE